MRKKFFAIACLTWAALIMASVTVHAALIDNGDFETGDLTAWNFLGNVGVGSDIQFQAAGGAGSFSIGSYAVGFGGGDKPATGILTQDIITMPNQKYELLFSYGRFGDGMGGSQSIQIAVINLIDDQRLIDTVITDSSGEWNLALIFNSYSYQFIATDSTTRLSFRDVSAGTISTDGILDNIQVNAVPIPAGLWLLTSGITCIAGIRLIRKKK